MKRHLRAWANHAALNFGAMLACFWYAIVPPQWTGHTPADLDNLAATTPWRAFWRGLKDEEAPPPKRSSSKVYHSRPQCRGERERREGASR